MKKITFLLIILIGTIFLGCKQIDNEYHIAVMLPLTGKGSTAGENAKKAINFCIEKCNEKGGVLGKKVIVNFYDIKNSEPKEGIMIAKKIIGSSVKNNFVVNVISGVVMSVQPILDKNNIIQLSSLESDNFFANNPKYAIRNYMSANQVSNAILSKLNIAFGTNKIKIIYPNNEWGLSSITSVHEQAKEHNVEIIGEVQYNEDELSYKNDIVKIKLNPNDILYVIGSQERMGRLIKQIRESGFDGIIIGGLDIKSKSALNIIGENRSNIYYTNTDTSEKLESLNQDFEARYGSSLDEISLIFYCGIDLLLNHINKIGSIDNEQIMSTINGIEYDSFLGNIEVKNNEIIYPFKITKLEDEN